MTEEETLEWESGPWTAEYDSVKRLGSGGQGNTFLAKAKVDQAEVAVKILRLDRDTAKARRRMDREVTALRGLSQTDAVVPDYIGSNIIEALDDKNLRPFVVMEYVAGRTLNKAIESNGSMALEDAINFAQTLSETVAIAHSEGTVHRDVKPQNIVLKGEDYSTPYLIDFGLSFNAVDFDNDLTNIHESVGTRFLSLPETHTAGPDHKRDPASDVTLLAGIFFYTLTGKYPEYLHKDLSKHPHRREPLALNKIKEGDVQFLNQFFDRTFQHDVEDRFHTVNEFQKRLNILCDQTKGVLPDVDLFESAAEVQKDIAKTDRSYQLNKLNAKHKNCFSQFIKYLNFTAGNKVGLGPTKMQIGTFGNVITESEIEIVRIQCPQVTVSIPKYRNGFGVCRYFIFAEGGSEVSIAFDSAVKSEPESPPNVRAAIPLDSNYEVIHTFYDWGPQADEFLKKHFNNWCAQTIQAINNMEVLSEAGA